MLGESIQLSRHSVEMIWQELVLSNPNRLAKQFVQLSGITADVFLLELGLEGAFSHRFKSCLEEIKSDQVSAIPIIPW